MTKVQARLWFLLGGGADWPDGSFERLWKLYSAGFIGQPSEIPESGMVVTDVDYDSGVITLGSDPDNFKAGFTHKGPLDEVLAVTTQPPSKPSQPDEVAEDPGEGEEALYETWERCGGALAPALEGELRRCMICYVWYGEEDAQAIDSACRSVT